MSLKNEYNKTLSIIQKKYFSTLSREEVIEKIEHFNFVNTMLSSSPPLYIDGLQGSIPAFLDKYKSNIEQSESFFEAQKNYFVDAMVYAKFHSTNDENSIQIYNNLQNMYINEGKNKSENYFYNDYYSSYRDGNIDIKNESPKNIANLKNASNFLCHLDYYGTYEEGKAIKDKDYDNYYFLKNIVEDEELENIEILYKKYKENKLTFDINSISESLSRLEKIGEKYDIAGISIPVMYIFNENTAYLEKALDKIENEFSAFSKRFHLEPASVGLGKINYVFSRSLLTTENTVAFYQPSGENGFIGTINLKEHIKTSPFVRVMDHEYSHAIDYYAGMQIGHIGDYFSELPLEEQKKNPVALEALRKVVYAVSEMDNDYLSVEEANKLAFEYQKNLFKSLLLHSFDIKEYAKLDLNKIEEVIEKNKEKVLEIFDNISWKWMENRQKIGPSFIRDIALSESFKDFFALYREIGGSLDESGFKDSLQEPLEIIKDSILDYNSRRDKSLHTFFKNPSNFAKEIANVSFNIETYVKEPFERFAWAVGGTDNEEIIPGVLSGFKDFCKAINIKTDEYSIINKETMLKKLKDLKQLEVPKKLYTVKY